LQTPNPAFARKTLALITTREPSTHQPNDCLRFAFRTECRTTQPAAKQCLSVLFYGKVFHVEIQCYNFYIMVNRLVRLQSGACGEQACCRASLRVLSLIEHTPASAVCLLVPDARRKASCSNTYHAASASAATHGNNESVLHTDPTLLTTVCCLKHSYLAALASHIEFATLKQSSRPGDTRIHCIRRHVACAIGFLG
jgi:hypothetical protein